MGFFNSLSQIHQNREHFNAWEKEQDRKQAQREALYQKREYTDEEISKAKALGKNIINIVDTMDNHSESVAENVETAFQPVVGLTPFLATLGTCWASFKFAIDPASKAISEEKTKVLKSDAAQKLIEDIAEYNKSTSKNSYLDTYRAEKTIFSKNKIQKIQNPELKSRAEKFLKGYENSIKSASRKMKMGAWSVPIAFLLSFIGINIYAAKLQVDSSKVARFQAREALKDPKAFVDYTPEQIEQAELEIANEAKSTKKGKKKKEKLKNGLFSSLWSILRDNKAYKQARANDTDESKIVTRPLSEEEMEEAKRDQEIIQRSIRLINNKAEQYSENMEVAAGVLIGGTPFLGAAVGGVTAWIINKTNLIQKVVKKNLGKYCSEDTMKQFENLNVVDKNEQKSISRLIDKLKEWGEFYDSTSRDLEQHVGKDKIIKASDKFKNVINTAFAHKKIGGFAISAASAFITGIAGALIGLKLQKSAARAGRYTAKRELEADPRNFIGYTDKDYKEVENVEPTKKKPSKFKEYALFIPTVIKQYHAYNKYRKHEFEHNKLLNEKLQTMEVSDKQLTDAKNLQRKLFNTFEKVDDNSQEYSESMEAAIEIAQPFIAYGGLLAMATPVIAYVVAVAKGKVTPASFINKVTGIFSKSSKLSNSKLFKKYLNGVEKNIQYNVEHTDVASKPIGSLLQDVKLQDDSLIDILRKTFGNLKNLPEELNKIDEWKINSALYDLRNSIGNKFPENKQLMSIVDDIIYTDKETKINLLKVLLNPKSAANMPKADFERVMSVLKKSAKRVIPDIKPEINIDMNAVRQILAKEELKIPAAEQEKVINFLNSLKEENLSDILFKFDQKDLKLVIDRLEELSSKSKEEFKNILNIEEIQKILQEEFKNILNTEEIQKILQHKFEIPENYYNMLTNLKDVLQHPNEIAQRAKTLLANNAKENENVKEINIQEILNILKENCNTVKSYTRNPKEMLNLLKTIITDMSDEEFKKFVSNKNILKSFDKKTTLEVLGKVDKMLANIPKDEFKKIFDTCIKQFNEHPDEFIKLVKEGKVAAMFRTPELENALVAAGISWTAFTLIITYAIESWLADLQLKAGRLGVMKSLEELDDPRYYANIEKTN